jgi:hypothetical protein
MDFKINDVVFDRTIKDYVRITNLKCALNHTDASEFMKSHGGDGKAPCQMTVPFEGIVIRVIGTHQGKKDAAPRPVLAWTYISIENHDLFRTEAVVGTSTTAHDFDVIMKQRKSPYWLRRI